MAQLPDADERRERRWPVDPICEDVHAVEIVPRV